MGQTMLQVFRENLRRSIASSELPLVTICDRAGYSTSYIRRILNGDKNNPTLLFVESIAAALDVNPFNLLENNSGRP